MEQTTLKVGDRVRYLLDDSNDPIKVKYYPPKGTLGTITEIKYYKQDDFPDDLIMVKWDCGTENEGMWWCWAGDVELVVVQTPKIDEEARKEWLTNNTSKK
jgi:hypothetical protein